MKRWTQMLMLVAVALTLSLASPAAWGHEAAKKEVKVAPAAALVTGTGFEGRVVVNGAVLPGAKVYAYRSFTDFVDSKPFAASALTSDDGRYTMNLPVGSYYLVAKKRSEMATDKVVETGDFFSFQGSNPIAVAAGKYTHVGFSMLPYEKGVSYQSYDTSDSGAIAGIVTLDGKPLDGVFVTLYVDTAEDLRGSTYATSPPTGKSGVFRFDYLPEVEYYVIARKRASGSPAGPLTDGDYFGFFPANPVHAKAGKIAQLDLAVNTKAGEIGKEDSLFRSTGTAVTGLIRDLKGKAVEGVYVYAYLEKVMAHKRPEFISAVVDKEGRYTLNLPEGGTYYLGARSKYGDTPALGEWYGRWEGTGDHSVVLKSGETLKEIDIIVEEILP